MSVARYSQSRKHLLLSIDPPVLQEPVNVEAHKGHRGRLARRIRRKSLPQ